MAARKPNRIVKAITPRKMRTLRTPLPIAEKMVELLNDHRNERRRLDALARGRKVTESRKRRRSFVKKETLREAARLLSAGGMSLNEMAPVLAKFAGLSPGYTRKLLYGSPIPPEHVGHILKIGLALYMGNWPEAGRIREEHLSCVEGADIRSLVLKLKPLPDAEREQAVVAHFFGFRT